MARDKPRGVWNSGLKNSSGNPGSEAFEKGQRRVAPLVILGAAVVAMIVEGGSLIVLPVVLLIAGLYWLIIYGGARLISNFGLRMWQRRKDS
jgi:hypothetical protein